MLLWVSGAKRQGSKEGTFSSLGVVVVEEAAAVLFIEDGGESPGALVEWLHVLDFDDEDIAGLCTFDFEGTAEVVGGSEIAVFDVVGAVVILDLAAGPI